MKKLLIPAMGPGIFIVAAMFRYLRAGYLLPMPANRQLVDILFTAIGGYAQDLALTECNGKGQTSIGRIF